MLGQKFFKFLGGIFGKFQNMIKRTLKICKLMIIKKIKSENSRSWKIFQICNKLRASLIGMREGHPYLLWIRLPTLTAEFFIKKIQIDINLLIKSHKTDEHFTCFHTSCQLGLIRLQGLEKKLINIEPTFIPDSRVFLMVQVV